MLSDDPREPRAPAPRPSIDGPRIDPAALQEEYARQLGVPARVPLELHRTNAMERIHAAWLTEGPGAAPPMPVMPPPPPPPPAAVARVHPGKPGGKPSKKRDRPPSPGVTDFENPFVKAFDDMLGGG